MTLVMDIISIMITYDVNDNCNNDNDGGLRATVVIFRCPLITNLGISQGYF